MDKVHYNVSGRFLSRGAIAGGEHWLTTIFQPSAPNFFCKHLDKYFDSARTGRIQFRIPTANGIVEANSNHFEFKAKFVI